MDEIVEGFIEYLNQEIELHKNSRSCCAEDKVYTRSLINQLEEVKEVFKNIFCN